MMFKAVESPYLVPFDGSFRRAEFPTSPPSDAPSRRACKERLSDLVGELDELQRVLYAHDRYGVLLVFQAMDAAGKDGTIRAVLKGVNPAGCQVFSFKAPTPEELDHDFLWRTSLRLPERGRIGVFNRSYYEEVLVVRVHPQFLEGQKLPHAIEPERLWRERFESILEHERHLARSGMVIVKLWLNVSREEQRQRFLSRIEEPHKNWKFSTGDVRERGHWDAYMEAYEAALAATSRPWAPWYAIPADDKRYMRMCVADILVRSLRSLTMAYPQVGPEKRAEIEAMRGILEEEGG